jgi:uncharacterized cupredoxin-like copper-binding protein
VRVAAVALAAGLVLAAACGGSSGGGGQPAGSTKVTLSEFQFDPSTLSVPHGRVVFFLVNAGNAAHDMIIRDASNDNVAGSELVQPGDSVEFDVDSIAAGEYTYFCDQPGHEDSGMHGKLTVT